MQSMRFYPLVQRTASKERSNQGWEGMPYIHFYGHRIMVVDVESRENFSSINTLLPRTYNYEA